VLLSNSFSLDNKYVFVGNIVWEAFKKDPLRKIAMLFIEKAKDCFMWIYNNAVPDMIKNMANAVMGVVANVIGASAKWLYATGSSLVYALAPGA